MPVGASRFSDGATDSFALSDGATEGAGATDSSVLPDGVTESGAARTGVVSVHEMSDPGDEFATRNDQVSKEIHG